MKKSVEILGLPIISITEGRELGISKSLLIDAKNGMVAALTIEDDDWYRGVKLIPYESIIAIGEDAVTITHSENILNLEEAGDYERLLVENIRVIGTKAITKTGRIQGKVTEVYIGDGGRIEKCDITTPDGTVNEVTAEQISIFGKQVTVIDADGEKKNKLTEPPAFEPAAFQAYSDEPAQEVWTPTVEEPPVETVETFDTPADIESSTAALEEILMPEPVEDPQPAEEIQPAVEEPTPAEEIQPVVEEPQPAEEIQPAVEEPQPVEEISPAVEEPTPVEEISPAVEEPQPTEEIQPAVEEPAPAEEIQPVTEEPQPSEEEQKLASMTQQAEDLKAALQKARASKKQASAHEPQLSQRKQVERAVDERRRRVLLGKHATKTIIAESGTVVVESGAEVTEEVLQRARLANKFIELSMNVQ